MSVRVREKKKRLYLDVYNKGSRFYISLGLTITGDKLLDKNTWHVAEICRAERELQLVRGEWGFADQLTSKKTLYAYLQEMG